MNASPQITKGTQRTTVRMIEVVSRRMAAVGRRRRVGKGTFGRAARADGWRVSVRGG